MEKGPLDVDGTLTINPQDMRFVFWAIGSNVDQAASGTNTADAHSVREVSTDVWQNPFVSGTGQLNPPISFTLEDSKQAPGTGRNFIRTVKGCTPDTVTITASQGEKTQVEVDYIGQDIVSSSGATSTMIEDTTRPFLWSDNSISFIDSAGNSSGLDTTKDISLEIARNIEPPHYLNGSRAISTPYEGNRNYTVDLTMDLDSDMVMAIYDDHYKGGSEFNLEWDMDGDSNTGSKHATFYMSGCRIESMENPSTTEGITESSITIRPKNITGSSWDSGTVSGLYNPW